MDMNSQGIRSLSNLPKNEPFRVVEFRDLERFKDLDLDLLVFNGCYNLPALVWEFLAEVKAKQLVVQRMRLRGSCLKNQYFKKMLQRLDRSIISKSCPIEIDLFQEDLSFDILVIMSQFSNIRINLTQITP